MSTVDGRRLALDVLGQYRQDNFDGIETDQNELRRGLERAATGGEEGIDQFLAVVNVVLTDWACGSARMLDEIEQSLNGHDIPLRRRWRR